MAKKQDTGKTLTAKVSINSGLYKKNRGNRRLVKSAAVVATALITSTASATSFTWDKGGGDFLWSNAANWNLDGVPGSSVAPSTGADDTVTFGDAASFGTIDLGGVERIVASVDFTADTTSAYQLSNGTLTTSLISRSSPDQINFLRSATTLSLNAGASGTLTINNSNATSYIVLQGRITATDFTLQSGTTGRTVLGLTTGLVNTDNNAVGNWNIDGGILEARTVGTGTSATRYNSLGSGIINLGAAQLDLRADATYTFGNNLNVLGNGSIALNRSGGTATGQTVTLGNLSIGNQTLTVTAANSYVLTMGAATLNGSPTINNTTANFNLASMATGDVDRNITKTGAGYLSIAGGTNAAGTSTITQTGGGLFSGTATALGSVVKVTTTGTLSEYLQNGAATAGSTYSISSDGIIGGNAAFLSSLKTSGAGTNLNAFPTFIAQTAAGGNSSINTTTPGTLANDASRFFAIAADLSDSMSVGTGTPWAGLSNDRLFRRLGSGTITANSDFQLRGLNGQPLVLGNGGTAGSVSITPLVAGTPVIATISAGEVRLDEPAPAGYTSNLTFVVANGATLRMDQANAFGAGTTAGNLSGNAKVIIQNGGTLNPGTGAQINTSVTIGVGGTLNLDDAGNISGLGTITQFPGSLNRIANAAALNGTQSPGTVAGSIVRVSTDNVVRLGTGEAGATVPSANYVVNVAGTTVNSVGGLALLAPAITLNSGGNVTVAGTTNAIPTGVLTNDSASRTVTAGSSTTVNSVITIGSNGGTIAATTGTTFSLRLNPSANATAGVSIAGGSNVLNFNAPAGSGSIDGSLKSGTVDFSGSSANSIVAGSVNILSGTLQNLGGGMAYTIGGGTGVTRVFNSASLITNTPTLTNTLLQVDSGGTGRFVNATSNLAGLQGAGSVIIGPTGSADALTRTLTVGANNLSTTFSGVISQNSTGAGNGGLIKTGTGTLTLAGTNTYAGPTNINLGGLTLAGGLGGTAVTVGTGAAPTGTAGDAVLTIFGNRTIGTATAGSLNVVGGNTGASPLGQGTLSLVDGTPNILTLANNTTGATTFTFGSNTDGNNAILNLEVGSTADKITLGALAKAAIGTSTTNNIINLFGIGGITAGTQVLIDAQGGLASGTFERFSLGAISGNTLGYNFSLSFNDKQLLLTAETPTAAANAYWQGDVDGNWSTNNAGNTNFATDATGGTELASLPGATTNVFFTTNNSPNGPAANLSTTLGADTAINSLTFAGAGTAATGAVTIAGNTLTINGTAVNGNAAGNGIAVLAGSGAHTISSNVIVGTTQSWTNSGTNALAVSGNVDLGVAANTLTIAGTGVTQISGSVSGAGSLSKIGTGTLTLGGANTYTGATTLNGGTTVFAANQNLTAGGANNSLTFGSSNGSTVLSTLQATGGNATFSGLTTVRTNSTSANTLTIGSGRTVTLNGGLTVGYDAGGGTGALRSGLTVNGAGELVINGSAINISVNQAPVNASYYSLGTLDLSALGSAAVGQTPAVGFTANVTNFNIAVGSTTTGAATVTLSNFANYITATTLTVGDTGPNNGNGSAILTLGTGINEIRADTINVGRGKGSTPGTLNFASQTAGSPGSVVITNSAGTGGSAITVGNINGVGTGGGATGTMDLRGHNATINASTLLIANNNGTSTGAVTGTFRFNTGTVVVGNLNMAIKTAGGVAATNGTLEVGGGNFTVNSGFTFGSQATAGTSSPSLTISGGVFTSNVNIAEGSGTVTSTLTLSDGVLNVTGKTIGAIDNLTFTGGTLRNAGMVSQPLTQTSTAAASLLDVLDSSTTINGAYSITGTASNSATVNVSLGKTLTASSISVNNRATIKGNGTVVGSMSINAGATIAPGASAGKLTTGNLTLAGGGTYDWELNTNEATAGQEGVLWDLIDLGSSTLTTTAADGSEFNVRVIQLAGATSPNPDAWFTIARSSSAISIDPAVFNVGNVSSGEDWEIRSLDLGGGNFAVQVSAVPEPTSVALLAMAGIGLLGRRRRQSR